MIKYDKEDCIIREIGVDNPWQEAVLYRHYFADGSDAVRPRSKIIFERAEKFEIRFNMAKLGRERRKKWE